MYWVAYVIVSQSTQKYKVAIQVIAAAQTINREYKKYIE